jgi:copper oxidase (laccase) domain-containing protein
MLRTIRSWYDAVVSDEPNVIRSLALKLLDIQVSNLLIYILPAIIEQDYEVGIAMSNFFIQFIYFWFRTLSVHQDNRESILHMYNVLQLVQFRLINRFKN